MSLRGWWVPSAAPLGAEIIEQFQGSLCYDKEPETEHLGATNQPTTAYKGIIKITSQSYANSRSHRSEII